MADYYISQEAAGEEVKPISTLVDYSNKTWPIDYETFGVASVAHNSVMEEVYFGNRSTKEQRIVFNQFYYPGWKAYLLDGEHGKLLRELPIIPEENGALGRMTVPVPQGEGYILLRYGDTLPRHRTAYLNCHPGRIDFGRRTGSAFFSAGTRHQHS